MSLFRWRRQRSGRLDPRVRRSALVGVGLAVSVVAASVAPAGALANATPDKTPNVTGSRVYAVVQVGSTIYLGGDFTSVGGEPRSNLAAIDADTLEVTSWNPGANRIVYALAGGPDGSLYVGGVFGRVAGQRRGKVAKFEPDGTLSTWTATAGSGAVRALAVDGNTLYLGGVFTAMNGQPRSKLAAVNTNSGELMGWDPNANGKVHAISVDPSDGTVFVGGFFTAFGEVAKKGVAALSPSTGVPTEFKNGLSIPAYSLALQPTPGLLYVAGAGAGGTIGALNRATGEVVWRASGNGDTQAVAASVDTVYLGGHFNVIGSVPRLHLAAFDADDGALLEWNPGANGDKGILASAMGGSTLLIVGDFTNVGGEKRERFARFSGSV